jgi:Uri superfamily endonuclease
MAMDLPEAKGTYVLIASVGQMKRLEIGRLGAYDIVPGFYAYVGSAFGAGGLRAPQSSPGINRLPALAY